MAFVDPEFYGGSTLQDEINKRRDRNKRQAGAGVDMESALGVPITSGITPPVGGGPDPDKEEDKSCPDGHHWVDGVGCVKDAEDPAPMDWEAIRISCEANGGTFHWNEEEQTGWCQTKSGGGDDDNGGEIDDWIGYQDKLSKMSARATIEGYLGRFGLNGLGSWVQQNVTDGISAEGMLTQLRYGQSNVDEYLEDGTRNPLYVPQSVRDIYDDRFPGMLMRRDNRLTPISEADYIDLERGYYQITSAAGLPPTFLESARFPMDGKMQTGVTQLIGHDVSLAEWRTRVTGAEEASRTANADIRDILVKEYKFTEGDITAAFLDPAAAISIVEARRNLGAAGLMAESGRVLGTSQRFNRNLSDVLQEMDVQPREIAARTSPIAGLSKDTFSSEGLTGTQLGEAAFGINTSSQTKMRRERERRERQFAGRTNTLASGQGMRGVTTTST